MEEEEEESMLKMSECLQCAWQYGMGLLIAMSFGGGFLVLVVEVEVEEALE